MVSWGRAGATSCFGCLSLGLQLVITLPLLLSARGAVLRFVLGEQSLKPVIREPAPLYAPCFWACQPWAKRLGDGWEMAHGAQNK